MSETATNALKEAITFAKRNIPTPAIIPFLGSVLIQALASLQKEGDVNVTETALQALWMRLDHGLIMPGVLCDACRKQRHKPGEATDLSTYASYLALDRYFQARGNLTQGLQFQLDSLKSDFGVENTQEITHVRNRVAELLQQELREACK